MARNRIYISAAGKQYKKDVKRIATEAGVAKIPKGIPIAVRADWYRAIRSGDLDNRMKILWDALQGVVFENDSQIVEIHARRFDDKANPRMVVSLWAA